MHILSGWSARELEAVSDLVLLDMCEGADGLEPTMLIKTSTLNLKYLSHAAIQLKVTIGEPKGIRYSLIVADDEADPLVLWSEVKVDEEADALAQILAGEPCVAFMFNEWSVPTAWAKFRVRDEGQCQSPDELLVALGSVSPWVHVPIHTYRDDVEAVIDLSDSDEGGQQEKLAAWIVGRLGRGVSVEVSPAMTKGLLRKEITDILVTWHGGALALESKALGVLSWSPMPDRARLSKRAGKDIEKARSQLVGAVRTLRKLGHVPSCTGPNGTPGAGVEVVHAAALVSDLSVLRKAQLPSPMELRQLVKSKGIMWHVLDPHELVRLVQAAAYYSDRDRAPAGTVLDALLVKRFEVALDRGPLIRGIHQS